MGKTSVVTDLGDDWEFLPEETGPLALSPDHEIAPKRERLERLRDLEDQLLERALTGLSDGLYFRDIQPGQREPPPDWQDMDPDEAQKRLRMANAAWMNKREAPVGLDLCKQVAVGIIKARATEKSAPKTLNVQVVQMSAPLPRFEVIDMDEDDG